MNHEKRILVVLIVILISFFSPRFMAAAVGEPTYNLSGHVTDNYGSGLENALVKNGSFQQNTLSTGYYLITLLPNGTYTFTVSKPGFEDGYLDVTISGEDNNSADIKIYDGTPPSGIITLTNDTPTQTTVNLTWNSIVDATYYQIFRNSVQLGYTQNNYWNDTGLDPDTSYIYEVNANDSYNNWGSKSSPLSVKTAKSPDITPPATVVGLVKDKVTETTIDIHWTPNSESDLWGYEVFRNGNLVGSIQQPFYNDTGLTTRTLYQYKVRAKDISGNIGQNSTILEVTTIDITPPNSVSQTKTVTGNFYINNSWINPGEDFDHVLFRNSDGTFLQNISAPNNYLNLTWSPHYTQNISAQTVDTSGNVNQTKVWFNATILNNPPDQVSIGNIEVYKGQLLTFTIEATDADSDPITYLTNAPKGFLDNKTGVYTWTPQDSDAGIYSWKFSSSDGKGGIVSETINVTIKNPLGLNLKLIEPYAVKDNSTWVEMWRDANSGHIGKFIGFNSSFKNMGVESMILTVTQIFNNKSNNPFTVTLAKNESQYCQDVKTGMTAGCRLEFEIGSIDKDRNLFNFTLQINVRGYNGSNFIFGYENISTVSLKINPISKIIKRVTDNKDQDIGIVIVRDTDTSTMRYIFEANSSVNLTEVSIYSPFLDKYFNYSEKLERNHPWKNSSDYPATTADLSRYYCGESYKFSCIINIATITAKTESGDVLVDYDYVRFLLCKDTDEACTAGLNIQKETTGSSPSGGGGGGGGGGGIPPSEDFKNIERREVREMDVFARSASAYIFKSADPVMAVSFESSVSENGVPVAVEVLKNRSKAVGADAPGNVYKNFNVFAGTSGFSKKVGNGVIIYKVNNSWLEENGLDPEDISLYKWQGDGWVKKSTEIAESRPNQTYYASLVGNFSNFAISGVKKNKAGSLSDQPPDIPSAGTENISTLSEPSPSTMKPPVNFNYIIGIIPLIGIVGLIYYLKVRHNK